MHRLRQNPLPLPITHYTCKTWAGAQNQSNEHFPPDWREPRGDGAHECSTLLATEEGGVHSGGHLVCFQRCPSARASSPVICAAPPEGW